MLEKNKNLKKFALYLSIVTWLVQALVLPSLPPGTWPNVAALGPFGMPYFLIAHFTLSIIVLVGMFLYSHSLRSDIESKN